jgi:hypothetical protein
MFARGPADTSRAETGLQYGGKGESGLVESTAGNKPRERTENPIALPWNLSIQHAYSTRPGGSPANTINTQIDMSPTDKWRVSAGVYVDLVRKEVISNSLSLYRDLHCWEIRFDHRRSGAISEYSFRIAIKQIPDVQYQRQGR